MKPRHSALAVLVMVIWGVNFVAIDKGLAHVPPLLFLAIRFTFVALPWVFVVPRPNAPWRTVVLIGLFMSLGQFSLLYLSLHLGMPSGLASLMLQAQVIFTIVIATVAIRERPSRRQTVGAVVGTVGLVVVVVAHGASAPVLPVVVMLGAALSWAIGNVVSRASGISSGLSLVVWSALVVPLPAALLSLLVDGPHADAHALAHFSLTAVLSTAYTTYGASLVGYTIWNGLLSRYPAGAVVPFVLLVPIVGVATAWVVQHERPTVLEVVGGVVMLAGVATATIQSRRALTPPGELSAPSGPAANASPAR